jgi:DNA-binding SARP family transcriptional activator/tetratricopeptide (TPR) repeat protein
MEFRLLGPLEVVEHGRSCLLGGRKQRSLLALLLLNANDVVSTDRIVDELWGESPPATVAKSVQVYVSRLRKELGHDRLVTREPGYLLRVEPAELDLDRFRRLVGEADGGPPGAAAERLREALALWRGSPIADLAGEPFAQGPIAHLEELRLAALEQRIDAGLAGGRHAELIGELEALVAAQPFRERPRAQLMLALYRSGRQAEALEVYRGARRTLADELGIEPGRELRELERAMLVQDPSLELPPQAASVRSDTDFVGRARELAVLDGALASAAGGRGRLVLVAGEPGIGKTRLIDELCERARAGGADVLVGRCWEAGGAPAYWPWLQALRAHVRATEPEALRAQLGAGAPDVAQLLPELRQVLPGIPEAAPVATEGARFRMFDAVSTLLRSAARIRPLVLVLDDVHGADEPSLLLLRFVARELAGARLLVVCAFRDVDPAPRDPLIAAVAELTREPHVAQITLPGLSEKDVMDYIERATGSGAPARVSHAIHSETAGNPLFVVEVVRLLDSERGIAEATPSVEVPPGIRALIAQRLGRLPERCRLLLAAASVIGREFGLDALARMTGAAPGDVLGALEPAMTERIVGAVPGSPVRLAFGHALIREALYDEIGAGERLRMHERAGDALESLHAADPGAHAAQLARHFLAAAADGTAEKAIGYARLAADRAASQLAYEEAARLLEIALPLVEDPIARCDMLLELGDARARAGDTPAAKQAFGDAATLAERHRLAERLGRAALGYGGRIVWEPSRDDNQLHRLLQSALTALGDVETSLRVRLLARLAGAPRKVERSGALSEQALALARRIGDPATLVYAIDAYIPANESPANTEELLALATEQLELAMQVGDKERVLEAHEHRLGRLLELADMRAAEVELDAMAALADELRQPAQRWLVGVCAARMALLQGRLTDAEGLMLEALEVGERAHRSIATSCFRLQLYVLRREQGAVAEVEELVRRSVREFPGHPLWRCVLAQLTATVGPEAEARRTFEALAADDFAVLPFQEMWTVSMGLLAETAAALGDAERASVLYEVLLPYAGRIAVSYPECSTGAVARHLGLLSASTERWQDAERHFERALATNDGVGATGWYARTCEDYARTLLARGAPGDRERAVVLASRAGAICRELGMRHHDHGLEALRSSPQAG